MGRNDDDRPARYCDCCQGELWPYDWYYETNDGRIFCEECITLRSGDEDKDL